MTRLSKTDTINMITFLPEPYFKAFQAFCTCLARQASVWVLRTMQKLASGTISV